MFKIRSRSTMLMFPALVSMALGGFLNPAPSLAQADAPLPDIAAMLLRLEDIDDAGIGEQLYPYGGTCFTTEQYSANIGEAREIDPLEVLGELDGAGLLYTCGSAYALPSDAATAGAPVLTISSYSHVYGDADGAESGFAYLEDESADATATDLPDGAGIGDESEATLTSGTDNIGEYQSLDLAFRFEHLTGGVTIRDYSGDVPTTDLAIELVDMMQDRMDDMLDGDTPGFSTLVLPWDAVALPPVNESRYLMLDGDPERMLPETDEVFDVRVDSYGRADAVYQEVRTIPFETPDSSGEALMGTTMYQFRDAEAASEFMEDTLNRYGQNPEYHDLTVEETDEIYGDASLSIQHGRELENGAQYAYDRVAVQVDDVVVEVGLRGSDVPESLVMAMVGPQVECVEEGECSTALSLPLTLSGITLEPNEDDRDDADTDRDSGNASDAAFVSELYPYSIDFSDDWELEDPQAIGDMELLSLSNGTSGVVIIVDTAHDGDVESCLDGAVAYIEDDPEMDAVKLMEDEDGDPFEMIDGNVAYAAYSYETADGVDMALYAECRTIIPGEVTMEFNQFVALDDFEDEIEAREDLLDGIIIDD